MKIVIQCSDDESREAEDIDEWIREGGFESDIDIKIKVQGE